MVWGAQEEEGGDDQQASLAHSDDESIHPVLPLNQATLMFY